MSWLPPLMWEPGCCRVTIKTQVTHVFILLVHKTGLDPELLQVLTVRQCLGHVCSVKLEIKPVSCIDQDSPVLGSPVQDRNRKKKEIIYT